MPDVHEDTHFDSAESSIDSANSLQKNKCRRKSLSVVTCAPYVSVLHGERHLWVRQLLLGSCYNSSNGVSSQRCLKKWKKCVFNLYLLLYPKDKATYTSRSAYSEQQVFCTA